MPVFLFAIVVCLCGVWLLVAHANRGNVAIIVWNTLEAPYVWDVNNTEYEGTINLGNSERSLLSIYFRDFSFEDSSKNRVLKEAEYMTVEAVPSTDGELGEHQIKLAAEDDDDADYSKLVASIKDTKKPRGTDKEEWTTVDDNVITAYAPTFDNLDSFYGKVVTVIFGKDNEVVSIRIVDDTLDNEYLTAFDKDKLTIGDKTYKFDSDADVYVNTVKMTSANTDAKKAMSDIAAILKIDFSKDYNKVIKANVTLSSKDKVTRLDLFVSGNYEEFLTKEAVVSKVRSEIITLTNKEEVDYSEDGEYYDEDDQPRVIKDNKIIALDDIEVGDVLTYYYKSANDDTIKTIYVSSAKKEGELTRVSKTDLKMTVDGEKYYSSMGDVTGKFLFTDDKISDAKDRDEANDQIGEDVTLYLNVYGEYVLMASEKASENWVFGIVTKVYEEDDDDEDVHTFYKKVRILLADGTTSRNYKFVYDDEETYTNDWDDIDDLENTFIVFSPDANGEIELDDYEAINVDRVATTVKKIADDDYEMFKVNADTEVDDDRQRIEGKVFSDSTAVFTLGFKDGKYDPDVSKDWKILVKNDSGKKLQQDTVLVYEKDSKTLECVLIKESDYATSDSEYAIVVTDDYKEKKGSTTKKYVDLLLANASDAETFEAKSLSEDYVLDMEKMFVEYQLSGSKLEDAALLIDLPAFKKLKGTEVVTEEVAKTGIDTKLVVDIKGAVAGKAAKDAVHGTVEVECPNKADDTATTCDKCTLVKKYEAPVAEHYEISADADALEVVADGTVINPGESKITVSDANDKALTGTNFIAGNKVKLISAKAEVKAVHGKVEADCPNKADKTATSCNDCTLVTPHTDAVKASKGTTKANFRVTGTQKLLLEYEDDEDTEIEAGTKLGDVILDEDVVVYDARGGKIKEVSFSALRDEVEKEGYVYVIPFANSDAEGYNTADVEANILVIVD